MSLTIQNVRLAHPYSDLLSNLYTIRCEGKKVLDVILQDDLTSSDAPDSTACLDGRGALIIPSLCHSHIHLDKCFILDKARPLNTGSFHEAFRVTSSIKKTFIHDPEDLYRRGEKLILQSIDSGVTSMRAHVEVDKTVEDVCLKAGTRLKEHFRDACDVQLYSCKILYSMTNTPTNASIVSKAVAQYLPSLGAIGSAPYVERTREQQKLNICFVLDLAIKYNLHVDFHIDYDLSPLPSDPFYNSNSDSDSTPLVCYLIDVLREKCWEERMPGRTIILGHATRLTLFSDSQLSELGRRIGSLPIYFVGLPQSDLYMMGRDGDPSPGQRGTLNVCRLDRTNGLRVAMSVNNVGNAFTPQGTPDPLTLCPLGVAVYQDSTIPGCQRLLEAVTSTSKCAIGLEEDSDDPGWGPLIPSVGSPADFVILHTNESLQSAVLEPSFSRTTIQGGRVVARREVVREHRLHA